MRRAAGDRASPGRPDHEGRLSARRVAHAAGESGTTEPSGLSNDDLHVLHAKLVYDLNFDLVADLLKFSFFLSLYYFSNFHQFPPFLNHLVSYQNISLLLQSQQIEIHRNLFLHLASLDNRR